MNPLSYSGWDRSFLFLSSELASPFCTLSDLALYRLAAPLLPSEFDQASTKTQELGIRLLFVIGTFFALSITIASPVWTCIILLAGVASKTFRALGFALQKNGYTQIAGKCIEKPIINSQLKVMTFNACGLSGGLSKSCGGTVDLSLRIEAICKLIQEEDPDVLFLQEIFDTKHSEALIALLEKNYAHIFMHQGPSILGLESGSLIFCKLAISSFSHTSFRDNGWINRGFSLLEIKENPNHNQSAIRFIGTHLASGSNLADQLQRKNQLHHILESIPDEKIPTFLAGDFNIERDATHQEDSGLLSKYFSHSYLGKEPTCTNKLTAKWNPAAQDLSDETIDNISQLKPFLQQKLLSTKAHLVKTFDETYNTKTALSDHHAVIATIFLKNFHETQETP